MVREKQKFTPKNNDLNNENIKNMPNLLIVTGSSGLIGSETVRYFTEKGLDIVGIDNDMRKHFFGKEASTKWNSEKLEKINY